MAINPTDRIFFDGKECRDVFFDGHLHQEAWMEHDGALECVWRKGGKAPDAICPQMLTTRVGYSRDAIVGYYKKPDGSWSYATTMSERAGMTPTVWAPLSYSAYHFENSKFIAMWQAWSNYLEGLYVISFDGFTWQEIPIDSIDLGLRYYGAQCVEDGFLLFRQFENPDYFDIKFLKVEKNGAGVKASVTNLAQLQGRWRVPHYSFCTKDEIILNELEWDYNAYYPKNWQAFNKDTGLHLMTGLPHPREMSLHFIEYRNGKYLFVTDMEYDKYQNTRKIIMYTSTDGINFTQTYSLANLPSGIGFVARAYENGKFYMHFVAWDYFGQIRCNDDFTNFSHTHMQQNLALPGGYWMQLHWHLPSLPGTRLETRLLGASRFRKVFKNGKWIDEQYHFCEKLYPSGTDPFQIVLPADLINLDPSRVEYLPRYDSTGGFPEKWNSPPFTPRFIS